MGGVERAKHPYMDTDMLWSTPLVWQYNLKLAELPFLTKAFYGRHTENSTLLKKDFLVSKCSLLATKSSHPLSVH
jgi:hypothetical protein